MVRYCELQQFPAVYEGDSQETNTSTEDFYSYTIIYNEHLDYLFWGFDSWKMQQPLWETFLNLTICFA
jgi:hypothetical protein